MKNSTFDQGKQLTPRQQRTLDKLENKPKGVCSFDLRTVAGVKKISDVVCQLEDYTDQDVRVVPIVRYFLHP